MAVAVRRAVLEDAAGIAAVHVAARQAAYRDFISDDLLSSTFSTDFTALWEKRLAAQQPQVVLVATSNGVLVGYCMLLIPSDDQQSGAAVAEVTRMSVSPQAWRSGIGTALIREAVASLERDGWTALSLWVLERNARARAFYSRLGFQTDGAEMVDPWSGQTELRMRFALTRRGTAL